MKYEVKRLPGNRDRDTNYKKRYYFNGGDHCFTCGKILGHDGHFYRVMSELYPSRKKRWERDAVTRFTCSNECATMYILSVI